MYIADVDATNKDDVIRVKYRAESAGPFGMIDNFECEISYDGATRWMPFKSYR